MSSRRLTPLLLLPFTLSILSADVTLRYKTEMVMNVPLAGAAAASSALNNALPHEVTLLEKDGKALSTFNAYNAITDFNTQQVVLLDNAGKRYAKADPAKLAAGMAAAMPQMPAAASALLGSMKMTASAPRATGRTAVIQGVEAEEQEVVLTIDGPPIPGMPAGPMVREVLQIWLAKQSEILRVPAIRELTGYQLSSLATTNPVAAIGAILKQLPGAADLAEVLKTIQQGVMLRMHLAMYMPSMAQILRRMPAGTSPGAAAFGPEAPLMQMNQEAVEISSASIPASSFAIPEGFQEVPAADLIKTLLPATPAPAASTLQ
ncbi:MAG TPA: hypothetical protein VHZ74_09005 [Bryobacteraceae bacterium]|nr:hypothetical protein [Bryobacteraceae bacterium]